MKHSGLMAILGIGTLLGLSACVVQPAPVAVAPAPVVVAPAPAPVVVERARPRRLLVCPVGYHLGPHGRKCRPNRR